MIRLKRWLEVRTAVLINPDFALNHTVLGAILAAQGKLDEAVEQHFRWRSGSSPTSPRPTTASGIS